MYLPSLPSPYRALADHPHPQNPPGAAPQKPNRPNIISESPYNLIVVGGGAAGFFAAIHAAENLGPDARVLILEKSNHVLTKVKISGGGRCNVTHACFEPKTFATNYPRGHKSLIGPLHRWSATDTIDWFASRGVGLKTEADGRMFPTTDSSHTIIDCLTTAAHDANVEIRTATAAKSVTRKGSHFTLTTTKDELLETDHLLLATGGTRSPDGARLATSLGHTLSPAVPSLFTFTVDDPRIANLQGLSVPAVQLTLPDLAPKLSTTGPLLVTHWGLSGPAVLRLSAWAAREVHAASDTFTLQANFLPDTDVPTRLADLRATQPKRQLKTFSPFDPIPKRLWERLLTAAAIPPDTTYAQLSKAHAQNLNTQLTAARFAITGKSMNKDEFVTCGGVHLREIDLRTMQSTITPNLYFAGEILDIDGVTGGFNFQNAWTSAHLAATAITSP